MKRIIFAYAVMASLLFSCKQTTNGNTTSPKKSIAEKTRVLHASQEKETVSNGTCEEAETLVYESKTFSSYTEDKMRGQGVISFTMNIHDRLNILNEDDTRFGEIVLNEDMTFFTLTMPKKVVARKVIPNYDFAAFDFDSESINSNKDYLFIYMNKQKKKVKKSDVKFTYMTWEDYIKNQTIKLKNCNLLTDISGKVNYNSKKFAFTVTEVKDDEIRIKSTKDCFNDDEYFQNVEGRIKWKSGGTLIVNFANCN